MGAWTLPEEAGAPQPVHCMPGVQPRHSRRPARLSTTPLQPLDEAARLAHLHAFGILDTAADEDYDRLVQLAATLCGTPMAALGFIDRERQWFKSRLGIPVAQVPRDQALCAHAILEPQKLLEIHDLARLPGGLRAPWGAGAAVPRFHAAMPIRTREGSAIGTLCVMDTVPRRLNAVQKEGLAKLAQAVAAQLQLRRQLQVATQTDRLTGLSNWFAFEERFAAVAQERGVLGFVRLRTINQINSAHGFRIADALIRQAADRLRTLADERCIGRIKRGLFILFFPAAEPESFMAGKAREMVQVLQAPYEVGSEPISLVCPVNLGFASFPRDGRTLDEVILAADAALAVAIEQGRTAAFFDPAVHDRQSQHYRLEPELRRALRQGEFVNWYQPKVDLASDRIVGVEALVRWRHPVRGLVPPGEFVPALEATGLIGPVGSRILERAVADWKAWRAAGLAAPRIAVNVAVDQLRDDDFVRQLEELAAGLGTPCEALAIEVTESVLIGNMERAIEVLAHVRSLGIPVAIDDFGTGYSSLAYIVTLPIDELKIDREFVRKITEDRAYEGIVRTCVSLAQGLNLKVVAEGVETEAQAALLRALHCDQAQGFLYSRPVPAEELAGMLGAAGGC